MVDRPRTMGRVWGMVAAVLVVVMLVTSADGMYFSLPSILISLRRDLDWEGYSTLTDLCSTLTTPATTQARAYPFALVTRNPTTETMDTCPRAASWGPPVFPAHPASPRLAPV